MILFLRKDLKNSFDVNLKTSIQLEKYSEYKSSPQIEFHLLLILSKLSNEKQEGKYNNF